MKEILNIYIIDSQGNPFFIRDNFPQGTVDTDHFLMTNFISAIQTFAKELGGGQAKVIKLGDIKIFTVKDNLTNIYFIIRATLKAKDKKIFQLLNEIKNLFIQKFTGKLTASKDEKTSLFKEFNLDLDKIVKKTAPTIEGFLERF